VYHKSKMAAKLPCLGLGLNHGIFLNVLLGFNQKVLDLVLKTLLFTSLSAFIITKQPVSDHLSDLNCLKVQHSYRMTNFRFSSQSPLRRSLISRRTIVKNGGQVEDTTNSISTHRSGVSQ